MNLIPRNSLFDFDQTLENFWSPLLSRSSTSMSLMPRVDVTDKKDHYEVSAELPGVDKKDIQLTLEDGVLTISAESRQENKEEKDGKVIRQERRYGKFVRSFDLGSAVQEKDVKANFKDGVLTLSVPKVEPKAPASHRIEIH